MRLKCRRKDCQYEWEYRGHAKFYATCPRCHSLVKIPRGEDNENRN